METRRKGEARLIAFAGPLAKLWILGAHHDSREHTNNKGSGKPFAVTSVEKWSSSRIRRALSPRGRSRILHPRHRPGEVRICLTKPTAARFAQSAIELRELSNVAVENALRSPACAIKLMAYQVRFFGNPPENRNQVASRRIVADFSVP